MIFGFRGALLTYSVLSSYFVIGSYPIGNKIKKIGHHITKKKISVSIIDIISVLTQ